MDVHDHPASRGRPTADPPLTNSVSRRSFMQTLGLSAAAGALAGSEDAAAADTKQSATMRTFGPGPVELSMRVNGEPVTLTVEPTTTLLDAMRVHLELTGTKEICDRGACGGCSILVDGTLIASCMMLAVDAEDTEITTIEGLTPDGSLSTLQESFVRHDALQCGYCTPGLVVACQALLEKHPRPTLDQIKSGLSGNLCRCGTYTNVFNAVLDASGQPPIHDAQGGRP